MESWRRNSGIVIPLIAVAAVWTLTRAPAPSPVSPSGTWKGVTAADTIAHGRYLVLTHACGDCHGGFANPGAPGWMAGVESPAQEFQIGACQVTPGAKPCFHTRPRNITPDNETGIGRFSERQIFNALRYGLRPEDTPDVDITSMTPGKGNFPLHPHYLAPPMPWPSWRYMPDGDLWAIAAYLKRGVKPVHNVVKESEGPPDFWASAYTPAMLGSYPVAPFPTKNEVEP